MGVLAPFPRIHHKVAETGAGRRHVLGLPRFDGGGLDDGHQHSLGRVVAEYYTRMLIVSHCTGWITDLQRQAPQTSTVVVKAEVGKIKAGGRYGWCACQSGVNMSFISKDEQEKKVVLLHQMVAEDVHSEVSVWPQKDSCTEKSMSPLKRCPALQIAPERLDSQSAYTV